VGHSAPTHRISPSNRHFPKDHYEKIDRSTRFPFSHPNTDIFRFSIEKYNCKTPSYRQPAKVIVYRPCGAMISPPETPSHAPLPGQKNPVPGKIGLLARLMQKWIG